MFNVGDKVRVLPPFEAVYPGEYTVAAVDTDIEGGPVFFLEGVESGFDARYLEGVA